MADHKSAHEVTIAPREEKSGFARWIEKNGLIAFAGLVLIAVVIVVQVLLDQKSIESERNDWAVLANVVQPEGRLVATLDGVPVDTLASTTEELEGSAVVGPWARYALAVSLMKAGRYDEADTALGRLQQDYPEHELNTDRYPFGEERLTLPARMRRICQDQAAWRAERSDVFENPAPPADAPRVSIQTTAGDIEVAFYPERAPEHVANFLKLADEDYYVGTKFHRVVSDFMIQGGDPNTREPHDQESNRWGEGGPDYKLPHESNTLKHFRGFVAAAKKGGETEESGSQFYITTGEPHHLNGEHTVFGKVVSGMDVVETIEQADTRVEQPQRPKEPVEILKVSRL